MYEIKIKNTNGVLTVSSLQIARDFGKRHDNVVRDIEILLDSFSETSKLRFQKSAENSAQNPTSDTDSFSETSKLGFQKSAENSSQSSTNDTDDESLKAQISALKKMFIPSTYKVSGNNKTYKCYDVTRDGFTLLVMGFAGKEALAWKLKYIDAFNNMERQLIEIHSNMDIAIEKILNHKIETAVEKVLDKKFKEFTKKFCKKQKKVTNKMVIEAVSETAKSMVTYFDALIHILSNLYKS